MAGVAVGADFFKRFRFNLADALAGHTEFAPHFFKCVINAVHKAVAHFKNLALLRREVAEDGPYLCREDALRRFLHRRRNLIIGNEVAKSGLLVIV